MLEEYLNQFFQHLKYERRVSEHTLRNYLSDLGQFREHLFTIDKRSDIPVTDIDHLTIREWMASLHADNKKKTSIARKLASLRTFFQFLVREGVLETNPAKLVATPKIDPAGARAGGSRHIVDLARRGAHTEALMAAEANGFSSTCDELSAPELLLLADAARYAGRFDRANEALGVTRRRFPSTEAAATAAFELGRIAMDVVRDDLLRSLAGVRPLPPRIPFYSSVSGRHEPDACLDVDYWWRNLRQPVLFAPAIEAMLRDGYDTVIEIGPHPALRTYFMETAAALGKSLSVLPTLRRKEDEPERGVVIIDLG